jgi:enediyne biosynthesis protein E4
MRRIYWFALPAAVAALTAAAWLGWPRPAGTPDELAPTPGLPWFVNVTARAGIDFVHFDPATPTHYIHETMGSGLGWIDFDGDGWPDLFCIQNGPLLPGKHSGSLPTCKLYRNNGDGTFTDVTKQVGLDKVTGFAMGCAVGDFDNDGYDDLAITFLGKVVLYHNQPGGPLGRRLVDVSERAGLRDPYWATSCAWGDVDGDGLLDLYICNYVQADLDNYPPCVHEKTKKTVLCAPFVFSPAPHHHLFRNNGDGTFTDISRSSGIASASPPGPGLGVVMVDLDGDGLIDIYAANDMTPAFLFHNQGNGKFVEKAALAGCGLDTGGQFLAGMGVAAGDVDGSGRPSLFVTNFQGAPNILFLNRGKLWFQDRAYPSGLGGPSVNSLGFGTVFFDADLDGTLDVAVANGHVNRLSKETFGYPYRQKAQLFVGDGRGHFRETSAQGGPYFRQEHVGRALAWADYDNDGKPDLVFGQLGESVALLRNQTPTDNHWLRLELVGTAGKSNRNAIGAVVEVLANGKKQTHWVIGGGSYLSASDRRPLFGLGQADRAESVRVRWPSGVSQRFGPLAAGRTWRLLEGDPTPQPVEYRRPARVPAGAGGRP